MGLTNLEEVRELLVDLPDLPVGLVRRPEVVAQTVPLRVGQGRRSRRAQSRHGNGAAAATSAAFAGTLLPMGNLQIGVQEPQGGGEATVEVTLTLLRKRRSRAA